MIMDKITREFIKIAYQAMQQAYNNESKEMTECDTETSKKVGEVLQIVGDLSRSK